MFYNDRASFQTLIQMMRSERDRMDENSPLMYHIHLVELLAVCTEGKNVYTEIKCNSLLPLDDIVRVVTHEDCIPEVGEAARARPPHGPPRGPAGCPDGTSRARDVRLLSLGDSVGFRAEGVWGCWSLLPSP